MRLPVKQEIVGSNPIVGAKNESVRNIMANVPVFQTGDEGSIPSVRSNEMRLIWENKNLKISRNFTTTRFH